MSSVNSVKRISEVVYNKSIGKNCFRMGLEIKPPIIDPVIPGQFIHLRLSEGFEPLLRRPFSIYNVLETSKNEPSLIEIVYQVVGKGTRSMAGMKSGRQINLLGPLGNGFQINDKANVSILVSGGIGTAGLHLLLKYLIEPVCRNASSPKLGRVGDLGVGKPVCRSLGAGRLEINKGEYKIYNLVGARSKDELYIVDFFKHLTSDTMIATEDGTKGITGLVTDLLSKLLSDLTNLPDLQIYACGPRGMIEKVCKIAHSHKTPCQVSLEQWMGCGIGICRACVCRVKNGKPFRYATVCSEGPVFESNQLYF